MFSHIFFLPELGSEMKLKAINAAYPHLLRPKPSNVRSSNSCTCALWVFAFTLIIWLVQLCLIITSPMALELDIFNIWQHFKFLGLQRQHPPSLKRRLLSEPGHFYHRTHYANRQSRGPLCQRAAAAFRGTVQDHQVLMSQERNKHADITHFPSQHTPLNYTCSTQVHPRCQRLDFTFFVFREKPFNLQLATGSVAHNRNSSSKPSR